MKRSRRSVALLSTATSSSMLFADFDRRTRKLKRAADIAGRPWNGRLVWIEVMSKGSGEGLRRADYFLTGFGIDEVDEEIGIRAALLRRERPRLRLPDFVIFANRADARPHPGDFETPGIFRPQCRASAFQLL